MKVLDSTVEDQICLIIFASHLNTPYHRSRDFRGQLSNGSHFSFTLETFSLLSERMERVEKNSASLKKKELQYKVRFSHVYLEARETEIRKGKESMCPLAKLRVEKAMADGYERPCVGSSKSPSKLHTTLSTGKKSEKLFFDFEKWKQRLQRTFSK